MLLPISKLFEAAGYPDYKSLPLFEKIKPKKTILIKSFDLEKKEIVEKKVTGLYYKGVAESGFEITSDLGTFLCTEDHKIYVHDKAEYVSLSNLKSLKKVKSILSNGKIGDVWISKRSETFPVLDIEVEDTEAYFSAGVLSHNTMGSGAGLLAESLKKLNPYLSRYDVSLIMVNQVRDDIGGFSPIPGMVAEKTPGGRAPKFYASWRGRVSRTKDITKGGLVAGNGIKIRNVKSKISYPKRTCELVLYYDKGFDTVDEVIDFICKEEFGLATIKGAFIYPVKEGAIGRIPDCPDKFQGRAKLKEFIVKWPGVIQECADLIAAKFESTLAMDKEIESEEETEEMGDGWDEFTPEK